jgi:farnesyl diphosphate synthase
MQIFDDFLLQFNQFLPTIIRRLSYKNTLQEALLYATTNGGKRIRPLLCFIFARMNNQNTPLNDILSVATALECIHCYSLVHDDLPSMDNDDLRRGVPTIHKQYTEATAILVGDALQTMAFEILSSNMLDCSADIKIQLIQALSTASGAKGMVNGQFLDMNLECSFDHNNLSHITRMHQEKTGALITASCVMGTLLADNNDSDSIHNAYIIGGLIGELFQIQDDILDMTQSTETLGKTAGKDLYHQKPTMTALMGLDNAVIHANSLTERLHKAVSKLSVNSDMLENFITLLITRHS